MEKSENIEFFSKFLSSKCHLKGKTLWKWANGQIYDSEKKDPGAIYTILQ